MWKTSALLLATLGLVRPGHSVGAEKVLALDFKEQQVYRAGDKQAWTAWVCLWKLRGGDVMLSFLQIRGDTGRPPSHNMAGLIKEQVTLRSSDGGTSWQPVATIPVKDEPSPNGWIYNGGAFTTVQQLSDGSLIGARWGRDWEKHHPDQGLFFRSSDEGRIWSEAQRLNDPTEVSAYPSRLRQLRDGSLLLAYEGRKIGYPDHSRWQHAGLFVSNDLGKTWSGPDVIAPDDDGLVAYPEPAFVELDDGSLLFLFRIENYPDPKDDGKYHAGNRRLCVATKKRGHWVSGPIRETPLPHGGHAELLLSTEGVLLYVNEAGHWTSLDRGQSWQKLDTSPLRFPLYYPQAVQLGDGRILVVGHVGGDEPFPPSQDMSVRCHWFRVRRQAE